MATTTTTTTTTTTPKNRTFAELLEAKRVAESRIPNEHAVALADHQAGQLAFDAAKQNPGAHSQADRRRLVRELAETAGALELIPGDSIDYLVRLTGEKFIVDHAAEIAAAGRVQLAQLAARVPAVKEPILTRIFEATRSALGLAPQARAEVIESRDRAEQLIADLEVYADSASTRIEYLAANPTSEALSDCVGGLAAFEHALTQAAAGK